MPLSLRLRAPFALIAFLSFACAVPLKSFASPALRPAQRWKSTASCWERPPFEKDYPGGYFHKTKAVVGARLGHPLVARLSSIGYAINEIVLTEGPSGWISLKGKIYVLPRFSN